MKLDDTRGNPRLTSALAVKSAWEREVNLHPFRGRGCMYFDDTRGGAAASEVWTQAGYDRESGMGLGLA